MAKGQKRRRRIPQRTCVACRQARNKRELVRIVRTATGDAQIDPTGKLPGRGAYLCRNRTCWELALAQRRLDHALKTTLNGEEQARLVKFSQALPGGSDQACEEP
ncbi:MAG: YlxR family protein [Anaerolineales bacterium]|nr:YlxR family protein [Anaerolineales bacterium]